MLHKLLEQAYRIRHKNTINILIYHQVLAMPDPMRPFEPTEQDFDWQMRLLRRNFTPISLDEAVEALKNNSVPDNAVVVTFDDGYLNNLTLAQPILEKYQIPATFYIATGFCCGKNMWNDRIISLFASNQRDSVFIDDNVIQLDTDEQRRVEAGKQLKQLKYLHLDERIERVNSWYKINNAEEDISMMMTPQQVQQLSQKPGVTIGAHTVDHPILTVHSEHEQREQILTSKVTLEKWLDKSVDHFAYPNGKMQSDFNEITLRIVEQCGFKSAVATNEGKCKVTSNKFALPRFTPWDKTPLKFHLRMSL